MAKIGFFGVGADNSPGTVDKLPKILSIVNGEIIRKNSASVWLKVTSSARVLYEGVFDFSSKSKLLDSKITTMSRYEGSTKLFSTKLTRVITIREHEKLFTSKLEAIKANKIAMSGNDVIRADDFGDVLWGYAGNDRIFGGGGADTIRGGTGRDTLYGGPGEDKILGDAGNDSLYGGPGNDIITGGKGIDQAWGQGGQDTFRIEQGAGYMIIKDFTENEDKILLGVNTSKISIVNRNGDAYIYRGKDLLARVDDAAGDLERSGDYLI